MYSANKYVCIYLQWHSFCYFCIASKRVVRVSYRESYTLNLKSLLKMDTSTNTTSEDKRVKQLTAILYLLQENLENFIGEVDKGYQLFTEIGEKTELVQTIEKMIDNPLGNLSQFSEKIDGQIKTIVDKYVKNFLTKNQEIILRVVRSETSLNNLHYSIALKEDNMDNRLAIFDFCSIYSILEISTKYPVCFQFVPIELLDKVRYVEELKLAS